MNLQWVHTSDLESAGQSGTHLFMSQVLEMPQVTWNAIINNHERCIVDGEPGTIVYFSGGWMNGYLMNSHLREIAHPIREELRKFKEGIAYNTHLYCNMGNELKTYGKHHDQADVFFIPMIGDLVMKVWNKDSEEYKYNMTPGDVLYIPAGLDHESVASVPRASLSFGIEFNED